MQRIDHASNVPALPSPLPTVSPGYFRRPSTLSGDQGTIVTADFLNDVQENLAQLVELAGLPLTKGTGTDVSNAVVSLIGDQVDAHAAIASTNALAAHLRIATQAEAEGLLLGSVALSPAGLRQAFGIGANAQGSWIRFPTANGIGKFIAQWGSLVTPGENFTVTLAQTMLDANYFASVVGAGNLMDNLRVHTHTQTQFEVGSSGYVAQPVRWFAFGQSV